MPISSQAPMTASISGCRTRMCDDQSGPPVPRHAPIGAEDKFRGMVDLVKMKGVTFDDETMGAKYQEIEIPADLLETAKE